MNIIKKTKREKLTWWFKNFKMKWIRIKYIIKHDKQYDYYFLLTTEKMKLDHMLVWYKEYVTWIDTTKIIKTLEECISMLEILIEEDDVLSIKYRDAKLNYYMLRCVATEYWWD